MDRVNCHSPGQSRLQKEQFVVAVVLLVKGEQEFLCGCFYAVHLVIQVELSSRVG